MFSSLRVSSPIYIFHKGQSPVLEMGVVQSINGPKPKYNMPMNQELVLDIQVKVGEQIYTYQQLPAQQEITDTFSNGENIVISDNKSAINMEIMNYQQKSKDIIASIDMHNKIINECEIIINNLNPEYAEKQQQQEQINLLNSKLEDMTKQMEQLMATNQKLIDKFTKGE